MPTGDGCGCRQAAGDLTRADGSARGDRARDRLPEMSRTGGVGEQGEAVMNRRHLDRPPRSAILAAARGAMRAMTRRSGGLELPMATSSAHRPTKARTSRRGRSGDGARRGQDGEAGARRRRRKRPAAPEAWTPGRGRFSSPGRAPGTIGPAKSGTHRPRLGLRRRQRTRWDEGAVRGAKGSGASETSTRAWFPRRSCSSRSSSPTIRARRRCRCASRSADELALLAPRPSRQVAQAGATTSFLGTLPTYVDLVVPNFLVVGDEVKLRSRSSTRRTRRRSATSISRSRTRP